MQIRMQSNRISDIFQENTNEVVAYLVADKIFTDIKYNKLQTILKIFYPSLK